MCNISECESDWILNHGSCIITAWYIQTWGDTGRYRGIQGIQLSLCQLNPLTHWFLYQCYIVKMKRDFVLKIQGTAHLIMRILESSTFSSKCEHYLTSHRRNKLFKARDKSSVEETFQFMFWDKKFYLHKIFLPIWVRAESNQQL